MTYRKNAAKNQVINIAPNQTRETIFTIFAKNINYEFRFTLNTDTYIYVDWEAQFTIPDSCFQKLQALRKFVHITFGRNR